jgi:hypothetical protein
MPSCIHAFANRARIKRVRLANAVVAVRVVPLAPRKQLGIRVQHANHAKHWHDLFNSGTHDQLPLVNSTRVRAS